MNEVYPIFNKDLVCPSVCSPICLRVFTDLQSCTQNRPGKQTFQMDRQVERQVVRQTDRQAGWEADRQTDMQADGQTDR